ncbi:hypothetical protein H634G_06728 [Metarhizium anisopliae BRIP 53293]|uniref:Translocation protein n=1 Tax=Metarhizium anisopliae BRIP 53293 TaxID=1291518 RepID=A0A0D9NV90_METAN|nr:hypothetical protein H634G_06728 [Metarhizium anisopliae BRIP 53293]
MFDIDWVGLALPFAYLMVLGGALMTFSTIYRKRKAAESANLAPWFGPNLQRNVYLSLLHMDPEDGNQKSPRVPDSVLKAALLRRAVEDIDRLIQIKSAKQACSSLLLRGSANALAPNWGPTIFQSAHEIAANTRLRASLGEIEAQKAAEKAWWEKRRGQIQSEFMKELDESEKSSTRDGASEDDAVLVDTPSKGKKGKK